MIGRSVIARKLLDIFLEEGRVLSPKELNEHEGTTVRVKHVRRAWNTYNRCLRAIAKRYPEEWEQIEASVPEGALKSTQEPVATSSEHFEDDEVKASKGADDETAE